MLLLQPLVTHRLLHQAAELERRSPSRHVDDRPGDAGDREAVDHGEVDRHEVVEAMDHRAVAPHVAVGGHDEVERSDELRTVEVEHGQRGWTGDPDGCADVEQHLVQLGPGCGRRAGEAEGVGADLIEDAALDPASKLAVGQAHVEGLRT